MVVWVKHDRHEVRNAFNEVMIEELIQVLDQIGVLGHGRENGHQVRLARAVIPDNEHAPVVAWGQELELGKDDVGDLVGHAHRLFRLMRDKNNRRAFLFQDVQRLVADAVAQAVVEDFVRDLDGSMREMAVGDTSVPRKVRKAAGGLYDRDALYRQAFEGAEDMTPAALVDELIFDGRSGTAATGWRATSKAAGSGSRTGRWRPTASRRWIFPSLLRSTLATGCGKRT